MKKWLPALIFKAIFSLPVSYRKLPVLFFLTGFCCFAGAQSVDLGLRGSVGAAYFINKNFSKSGTEEKYRFTLSDNYGLQCAMNFPHGYGFEVDILQGTLRQGYTGTFGSTGSLPGVGISYRAGESYSGETQINVIQVPILFRYRHKTGTYWEVGSAYEMFSSASYSATYSHPSFSVRYNTSNQYPAGNFLLIAGFGRDGRISKSNFYWNAGIRLTFGLLDVQGVDGHGQDISGPESPALYRPNNNQPYYAAYHGTHIADISLNAGIFYRFLPSGVHRREIEFN